MVTTAALIAAMRSQPPSQRDPDAEPLQTGCSARHLIADKIGESGLSDRQRLIAGVCIFLLDLDLLARSCVAVKQSRPNTSAMAIR